MRQEHHIARALPPLPLDEWEDTKETLHRYCQIAGKVRMELSPFRNHWWHLTLYVTTRGLSTGPIPYGNMTFDISFDLLENKLAVTTSDEGEFSFALDDLPVAEFYRRLFDGLCSLGIDAAINTKPFDLDDEYMLDENTFHCVCDREYARRYHRILLWVDQVFNEFSGRFNGKTSPVQLFWHSFDIAVTRFSGKQASLPEGTDSVTREAYSHEVISFGFWPGDQNVREPAFYSYTAPEPEGLTTYPLRPEAASWLPEGGTALLTYEQVRNSASPTKTLLEFMESAYQAGAKSAGWSVKTLQTHPPDREAAKLEKDG
ncbi:MAG: Ava_C0101 and related proteins [uncultured Rubrobacteraceae bacterium]|uniref:Ava_C0101 and related proteins n=1 Tax=uncultured Rubrobacteraceae bacterium TaxID=349277 RepID=A0A6J4PRY5_9ACTN|nr:MAG: Ava_C0101 and related proteins [uncultured Rubrobacteraceae bacterium]